MATRPEETKDRPGPPMTVTDRSGTSVRIAGAAEVPHPTATATTLGSGRTGTWMLLWSSAATSAGG